MDRIISDDLNSAFQEFNQIAGVLLGHLNKNEIKEAFPVFSKLLTKINKEKHEREEYTKESQIKTPTQQLIAYMSSKEYELSDFGKFETELPEKFMITHDGKDATKHLIRTVVEWEQINSPMHPLESILKREFEIKVK